MAINVFPLELRDSTKNWAHMSFWPSGEDEFIMLPIPSGLTFSDSMSYSSLDLGILGDLAVKTINAPAAPKGSGLARKTGNTLGAAASGIIDKTSKMNLAAVASIAAIRGRMDNVAGVVDYATKQVVAPNTRTAFKNSNVRQFQFQFKMVGRTKGDATAIKTICEIFQKYMYPDGDDVILKYPPTWRIFFYDGNGNVNKYIPGIYELYLTDLNTTLNLAASIFHDDGSPIEVDITIGFEETKALTRQEIVALRGSKDTSGGGFNASNQFTTG
jgi:hypothetical protein